MEKNFINAQIKRLRKALKLSQAAFGEKIGLKNGAISWMEKEGNTVTDQNIKLICEKFNVRREWLLTGEGAMQDSKEDSLFASFARQYNLTYTEQAVAKYLLSLPSGQRQQILKYVQDISKVIDQAKQEA